MESTILPPIKHQPKTVADFDDMHRSIEISPSRNKKQTEKKKS